MEASPEASPTGLPPAQEASEDAGPADATVIDSGPAEAGESVEASVEASLAEASIDGSDEAYVPEASIDAAPEAGPVAGCIPDVPGGHYIFGDHYLRSDGELFYAPSGGHTLITNAGTGLPLLGITDVVQQLDHACGLRGDGTVWCWPLGSSGGNTNGDLGSGAFGGTNLGTGVATQVVTSAPDGGSPTYLTGVVQLSSRSDTWYTFPTCAILGDHTVWCWGNSTAETGGPDGLFWGSTGSTASVAVATEIAASAGDGGPPPPVLADQVTIGLRHACILRSGAVSCWGQNVAGNLGIGNSDLSFKPYPVPVQTGLGLPATVDQVGAGFDYTCALAGGSIWCWGTNGGLEIGSPGVPNSICNSNYCIPTPAPVQQSALDGGSLAYPDAGADPSPLVGATSLYVGYLFACALDSSGTAWCWGENNAGVSSVTLATPYTSTQPYQGINELTIYGEGSNTGLRYLTAAGDYVSGNQLVTPYCQ